VADYYAAALAWIPTGVDNPSIIAPIELAAG
jgi:hypothetical protein